MRLMQLFFIFLVLFNDLVSALIERNKDYNTNILDELALEDDKAPVIRNADDDDEPFKELLSELKNDIGEISESSKRNTGGSSGVQPKGAALTTQSPTVTNSSINPITTQRPVPVSTEAKPNLQTATLMPNVNKNKTQTQIVKAKQQKPLGNNNHVNREKANGSSPQSNKRNRKKMNNPNQGQKAKKQREGIFSQMSCSKIKTSPTCVQIYHECTNARKIEVDRCNRMNSIRKKKSTDERNYFPKQKHQKRKRESHRNR